jgi:predicted SPOUT superfamily RNA methylase MTH1
LAETGPGTRKLTVAIPASLVSDTPHLREKTAKLGIVARACAIFGVTEIAIYADDMRRDQQEDINLCAQILSFIETPQYLRKRIFKLSPELKFAGILPPLQIPHHNVPSSIHQCKVGDIRDGVVVGRRANSLLADVGLERTIECPGGLSSGTRVTVRLASLAGSLTGEIIDPSKGRLNGSEYWGYRVRQTRSLRKLLQDDEFNLKIGTSRYGEPILDAWTRLKLSIATAKSRLVAFGSPKMGLREIVEQEQIAPEDLFDYYINTVPNQNVATVRTEEALLVTLGLLNAEAVFSK